MATNLQFIKSVTANNSNSLSIDEVFTTDYDVYYISLHGFDQDSTTDARWYYRFLDSTGTVLTGAYDYAGLDMRSGSPIAERRGTNAVGMDLYFVTDNGTGYGGTSGVYVYNPADTGSYTFLTAQSSSFASTTNLLGVKGIGVHKVTEAIRGFNISEFSGGAFNLQNGKMTVYGVK
jgi:hypothetical protein